jgi:ASC-1-like (ASCH) protein
MTARPAATGARAREANLYRRYLDPVAAGRKTIEVGVQYPNLRKLAAGDCICFVCDRDDALTRVKCANPLPLLRGDARGRRSRERQPRQPDQQLADVHRIYGPEKEAMGVLAIEIELLHP